MAVGPVGQGFATFFGPGSPLSQAQGIGLDGPASEADLDALDAFFDAHSAAPSVEVASLADPGLLPALCQRGYHVAEQTHVLARALPGVDPLHGMADGLNISRVREDDATARAACSRAVLRGFFDGPDEPPEAMLEVIDAMTAAAGASLWFARVGDAPAAGATLLIHDRLAMFAGDATVPEFRRRGVQCALIAARLAEAARLGCDAAVACTQPGSGSQRNYERMGFRLVYCRTLMNRAPR
ncbi:MAG: GNAT family N-acetyltransferase [Isosphaeraceae bacterium]